MVCVLFRIFNIKIYLCVKNNIRESVIMKEYLNKIRRPVVDSPMKLKLIKSIGIAILGLTLGLIQKWIDGKAINELPKIFEVLDIGNYFGGLSIWILLATVISIYSKSPLRAGINVLIFFISMLTGYYWYSNYILGFFPKSYMLIWAMFSFVSFFLAYICWYAKGKGIIAILISAIIVGVLFSQSVLILQGIRVVSVLGFIAWFVGVFVLYRKAKELTFMLGISIVVAIIYQYFALYYG